jgi:hypothetical protein
MDQMNIVETKEFKDMHKGLLNAQELTFKMFVIYKRLTVFNRFMLELKENKSKNLDPTDEDVENFKKHVFSILNLYQNIMVIKNKSGALDFTQIRDLEDLRTDVSQVVFDIILKSDFEFTDEERETILMKQF